MEKAGLTFETEFYYGEDVLPGWSEAERYAVKYSTVARTPTRIFKCPVRISVATLRP